MRYKSVENYIYHRPPMLLLDRIVDAQKKSVKTASQFDENNIFYNARMKCVPNWVGIEMLAQSAAAWVGMEDERIGREITLGFLLGVRTYSATNPGFFAGEDYFNEVKTEFVSGSTIVFKGEITSADGKCCAEGELTAFRPDDIEKYLRGEFE